MPELKESPAFSGGVMGEEAAAAKPTASPTALPRDSPLPPPAAELRDSPLPLPAGPPPRVPLLPRLRLSPLGFALLVLWAAAFTAGNLRQELALSLLGAILLFAWIYCLILGGVIALINRRRARLFVPRVVPRIIAERKTVELVYDGAPRFLRIPGILVRCRLRLETLDGRRVEHLFDPGLPGRPLPIPRRGVYYGPEDELLVFDALGIAVFSWPLPQGAGPRVLASPRPAAEAVPVSPRPGGREQYTGPHYQRTEDLIEHRPYIPGDDPRRINWKLYSHGPSESLFVREGETEPPPRSRLLILVDTEVDAGLYDPGAGREGVDLLCAQALAIALDFAGRGMDVLAGYTGGKLRGGDAGELAQAMAWPAALPLSAPGPEPGAGLWAALRRAPRRKRPLPPPELPSADRGTCILALPRTLDSGALDRFLSRRAAGEEASSLPCDIIFLCRRDDPAPLQEAAETCARLYGARNAVRAQAIALNIPGGDGGEEAP